MLTSPKNSATRRIPGHSSPSSGLTGQALTQVGDLASLFSAIYTGPAVLDGCAGFAAGLPITNVAQKGTEMLQQVARVGALTAVSIGVGAVLRPVGRVIGGAAETVSNTVGAVYKTVNVANKSVIRAADFAELKGSSTHEIKKLDLEIEQNTALVEYAEKTMTLSERFEKLPAEMKKLIKDVELRLPVF